MFCPNCGKQLNENENFCSECGTSAKSQSAEQRELPSLSNSENFNHTKKQSKKKIVIVLLVIIAIFFLLFIFIGSDEDATNTNNTNLSDGVETDDKYAYIKFPTYFMDDAEYNSWIEDEKKNTYNGHLKITEEYIILEIDKDKFEDYKTAMIDDLKQKIHDYTSTDSSFETVVRISYSDDFKEATIFVNDGYIDSDDSVIVRRMGDVLSQIRAMIYSDYSPKIKITIKGNVVQTVIDTVTYQHPTERALETDATELIEAYLTNEVAARKKYEDKYVCITGVVDSIGEDLTGATYITLSNDDDWTFESVQCYFSDEYINEVATLTKGTNVTVYGTQTDYFMNIIVEDCVLAVN